MTEAHDMLADLAEIAAGLGAAVVPAALDDGLQALTATARRFFGAAACSLSVLDDDTDELVYLAASGEGASAILGVRLPIGRGIAGWVAQSGQAIAVSDLSHDARFARDIAESTAYVPTALLAAPVEFGDRLLGVLSVLDRDETRPAAAADLESAALFAAVAASNIEARSAFADSGRIMLAALATAAGSGTALADAVVDATGPPRRDPAMREFAGLLARLYRAGPDERRLGVTLLRDVLAYADTRSGRLSSRLI